MRFGAFLLVFVMLAGPARGVEPRADDGVSRASAAFVGVGVLGSGAIAVATLRYLGKGGTPAAGLVALPLVGLLHVGLGELLGVPVNGWSAAEGTVLGLATAGIGFALGRFAAGSQGSLDENGLAVIGLVVGGAIGAPVWTLVDPFGLGPVPGGGADSAVFRAECDRRSP